MRTTSCCKRSFMASSSCKHQYNVSNKFFFAFCVNQSVKVRWKQYLIYLFLVKKRKTVQLKLKTRNIYSYFVSTFQCGNNRRLTVKYNAENYWKVKYLSNYIYFLTGTYNSFEKHKKWLSALKEVIVIYSYFMKNDYIWWVTG